MTKTDWSLKLDLLSLTLAAENMDVRFHLSLYGLYWDITDKIDQWKSDWLYYVNRPNQTMPMLWNIHSLSQISHGTCSFEQLLPQISNLQKILKLTYVSHVQSWDLYFDVTKFMYT